MNYILAILLTLIAYYLIRIKTKITVNRKLIQDVRDARFDFEKSKKELKTLLNTYKSIRERQKYEKRAMVEN